MDSSSSILEKIGSPIFGDGQSFDGKMLWKDRKWESHGIIMNYFYLNFDIERQIVHVYASMCISVYAGGEIMINHRAIWPPDSQRPPALPYR